MSHALNFTQNIIRLLVRLKVIKQILKIFFHSSKEEKNTFVETACNWCAKVTDRATVVGPPA